MIKGFTFYDGPSLIDGSPLLGIITGIHTPSQNSKTGAMYQSWIMPKDTAPLLAKKTGKDVANCGQCPIKPQCYVDPVRMGPEAIYKAWKGGEYPLLPLQDQEDVLEHYGRDLRMGSWGEPPAIPLDDWIPLIGACPDHTAYTHLWDSSLAKGWDNYAMASVETVPLKEQANERGWKTFRVSPPDSKEKMYDEAWCPANKDKGLTCANCPIKCNGDLHKRAFNVVNPAHGRAKAQIHAEEN